MKDLRLFLLFLLMSMTTNYVNAYDIAVENEYAVTIYYNYINENKELEVVGAEYSETVNIPSEVTYLGRTRKVTRIGERAFVGTRSKHITIGDNVTSIGKEAFCSGEIRSIAIGKKVKTIEEDAFSGMIRLNKVIINDISSWCNIEDNGNGHFYEDAYYIGDGIRLFTSEYDEISELIIPDDVSVIRSSAFTYFSNLTSVTIGNRVTKIGDYAFSHCENLASVTIGNSVKSIGEGSFYRCYGLTSVTIGDSVESIGKDAFYDCHSLVKVTMGKSLKYIKGPFGSFSGCDSLEKIIIKDIAAWCSCVLNENLRHQGLHLYSDENTEITDLVIPNGVGAINNYVFAGFTSLTSVSLPNSVTTIGYNAFDFTPQSIFEVISNIEEPTPIDDRTFSKDIFLNAQLYIPKGTLQKYKSTVGWKNFMFIEEGIPSGISSPVLSEHKGCEYYDISGKKLDKLQKGVNILRMKDGTTKKVVVK